MHENGWSPSTSLAVEVGHTCEVATVKQLLQKWMLETFDQFKKEGFASFHQYIDDHLAYKNRLVMVDLGDGTSVEGRLEGINEVGSIRILKPSSQATIHLKSIDMYLRR
eukprot:Platyproteum_vivax@DN2934_c0_g1_i2.p1